MLAKARARGRLPQLWQLIEADARLPITQGAYAAIAAIGVIGAGARRRSTLDTLMDALPHGRPCLAFRFNDHALADPAYDGQLRSWRRWRGWTASFNEHGRTCPASDLKSTVYVLEQA